MLHWVSTLLFGASVMHTVATISQKLIMLQAHSPYLVYGVIVVIGLLEGPILSIILGILLQAGFFAFFPVYLALMLGDLIGDTVWYLIGYRNGDAMTSRIGKFFSIKSENIDAAKELFHRHKYKILFFSKLTNGLGFDIAVLTAAGVVKIPFGSFIRVNLIGQMIWTAALIALGYFFSSAFTNVSSIVSRGLLMLVAVGVVVLFFHYRKRVRGKFVE